MLVISLGILILFLWLPLLVSAMFHVDSPRSTVVRQGSRPDGYRRTAIVAKKIESARRMMAAFGHKVNF